MKIIINAPGLPKVIMDVVVRHYGLPNSIITDWGSLFTSKFWFLLFYFLKIKRKLFTAFYPQTNGQTKRQNSTMEAYLRAFVNSKQNNWACLLPMAEFTYNNAKNASTSYTPFELNYGFHLKVSFKNNIDPHSRSCSTDKLVKELRELMDIYQQNLFYAQKLQKRAYDKGIKPWNYSPGEKVWLNSKYIKAKQNRKFKNKFFDLFQILHPVRKQMYKLDFSTKWKIHDVFHVLLLEQITTRKKWINKLFPEPELEFDTGNNKKYKFEAIIDSTVYAQKVEGHLSGLYYLVFWKSYLEEKSTWEPSSIVIHL